MQSSSSSQPLPSSPAESKTEPGESEESESSPSSPSTRVPSSLRFSLTLPFLAGVLRTGVLLLAFLGFFCFLLLLAGGASFNSPGVSWTRKIRQNKTEGGTLLCCAYLERVVWDIWVGRRHLLALSHSCFVPALLLLVCGSVSLEDGSNVIPDFFILVPHDLHSSFFRRLL